MALIKCPNCGKQYSEHAEVCPQCGLTLKEANDKVEEKKKRAENRKQKIKSIIPYVLIIGAILALIPIVEKSTEYIGSKHKSAKVEAVEITYDNQPDIVELTDDNQINIVNGSLPEGFSWAYGGWTYKSDMWGDVDLIIGDNYVQINDSFIAVYQDYDKSFSSAGCYPIYCFPKQEYTIYKQSDDVIALSFDGAMYYESYVTLNKQSKSVTSVGNDVYKRRDYPVSQEILNQYQEAYKNSLVWGKWRQQNGNATRNLSPSDEDCVLMKNGAIVSLNGTFKLTGNNTLLYCYSDTEEYCKDLYSRENSTENEVDNQKKSLDSQSSTQAEIKDVTKGSADTSPKETQKEFSTNSDNTNYSSKKEEAIPFQDAEVKPSFDGGDANQFAKWVNSQLQYPEKAKEEGVQGRIVLQFKVNVDGSVSDVKVLRGVNPDLDNEAIRVVSLSPKWKPGECEGRAVPVTYTFPVIFQLR